MSNAFSNDLEQFIQQEISLGHYASREELIVDAVQLLRRERAEALEGILAGWDDVERGNTKSLDDAFADMRQSRGIDKDA